MHLLDIRPSSIDALGLKFTIDDSSIIYGGIALLYLYHALRAFELSDTAVALLPLPTEAAKMRSNFRTMKKLDKDNSAKDLKTKVRKIIFLSSILLFPYYLSIFLVTIISAMISVYDLFRLSAYIVSDSTFFVFL